MELSVLVYGNRLAGISQHQTVKVSANSAMANEEVPSIRPYGRASRESIRDIAHPNEEGRCGGHTALSTTHNGTLTIAHTREAIMWSQHIVSRPISKVSIFYIGAAHYDYMPIRR